MAYTRTFAQLSLAVQQLGGWEGSTDITPAVLLQAINFGLIEGYRAMVNAWRDYFTLQADFAIVAGTIGGAFSVMMRAELQEPGIQFLLGADGSIDGQMWNVWITAHLGLQIPEHCGLRVGRQTRRWTEGQFLFFDTSYQHEAWNDSDVPRIVLLFDFLHHELSPAERSFFSREAA